MSATAAVVAALTEDKRAQAETVLGGILQHMGYPARMEFKDMPDGGIGVAVHFEGELPGITPQKRTALVDCIQFLVNKVVNRPNTEKRWVTLGVSAFPEPRPEKPAAAAAGAPAAELAAGTPATRPSAEGRPARNSAPAKAERAEPAKPAPAARSAAREADEGSRAVEPSPMMTRMATSLATKAATTGYFYAVLGLSGDDRARGLQAAKQVKGLTSRVEGDGHFRRLTFAPDKVTPISKKQVMPDYDDDDET